MTTEIAGAPSPEGNCDDMAEAVVAAAAPSRAQGGGALRRGFRLAATILLAQYTLLAIGTGLSVAAAVKYVVAPEVIGRFEAVSAALKRH